MNDQIKDMLDNIQMDNNAEALQTFQDIISVKLTDALDQRKQQVAKQLGAYNADIQTTS
jgi:hypothetical protein